MAAVEAVGSAATGDKNGEVVVSRLLSRLVLAIGSAIALMLTPWSAWAAALAAEPTTPTTAPPDGSVGYLGGPGLWLLAASVLVVIAGLWFAYLYHARLLQTIDLAVEGGQLIRSENGPAIAQSPDGKVGVSGPTEATPGATVTFKAIGYDDSSKVSWAVEGGKPEPSIGTGSTLEVTFREAGTATVTATVGKESAPHKVTVSGPRKELTGIVLPFAIQNWGRLVVTTLGVGVVSALMAWDVISAEGGIGLLGALLGIGAAAGSKEAESKPKSETATEGAAKPKAEK